MPTPLSRREVLQTAGLLGISAAAMSSNALAAESETLPLTRHEKLLIESRGNIRKF